MTNTPNIPTDWIRDIEPDPKFLTRMTELISDIIDEDIHDFAWQIATDYVPAPEDLSEPEITQYEDAVSEKVISPLETLILNAILDRMKEETE